MKTALYNLDKTSFPNYALMKLARYHKSMGDSIDWYYPMWHDTYDKIYCSSVFTFSKKEYVRDDMVCGGTGFNLSTTLPKDVENIEPDYSLYSDYKHALGFLTRGCIRNCSFCFVPEKEGYLRPYRDIDTIIQDRKTAVLMDNNVLACNHGIKQIERIVELGIKVDFNQGLDARLITDDVAKLLSRVKWLKYLRMSCDSKNMLHIVIKAAQLLRKYNCTPKNYYVNVLVKDIDTAYEICSTLKYHNLDPFAQPYRDKIGTEPPKEQKHFARWVNHKAIFKTVSWDEYNKL